jgi:hypothetical protein
VAAALCGCPKTRLRSDVNAPGIVHLEAPPPRENGDPALYIEAEDPGENELYIGPAVVLGPASGRGGGNGHDTEFEASLQVRLAYTALRASHRAKDVPIPRSGFALTLGWSPIQTAHTAGELEANGGPVYLEVERYFFIASAGLGVVAYPGDWDGGVQLTLSAMPYGIRLRYLVDGGFEVLGAFRLELPTAINWSR